ncbi:MAG: aminopeptidase [Candidatus Nanohaloarchaea archaeon]|nr:aminopeptidase [Candidatus Nanohaloarchaea archaeon]
MMAAERLREGAVTAVEQCLDVRPDETVLVVTDDQREDIGRALREAARGSDAETMLFSIDETESHGAEPPAPVAAAMRESDVVFAPTTYSLSHTRARHEACDAGARVATLPGITEEIFTTSMLADYTEIHERSTALYRLLEDADDIHVTTPSGTDITLGVKMKHWHIDDGLLHEPGAFGNLPAGEISGPPIQADGTIVIDSLKINGEDYAPSGTEVTIKNSKATAISEEDCRLAEAFRDVRNAANLAEIGIGTNPEATIIGNLLQDEKVMGTCHFAFGDNTSYGGSTDSEIHWDAVLMEPTIRFDDTLVMEDGDFVVGL